VTATDPCQPVRRQPRIAGLALVMALGLACACTDESEPDAAQAERDTTSTSAPPERADLADLRAAGVEARRLEPDLGGNRRFRTSPLRANVTVVGSDLLGWVDTGSGEELHRSADLGASWERVELPNAPERLSSSRAYEVGDRAVVTGSESETWTGADGYIWISDDGVDWHGGSVPAVPPDAQLTVPFTQLPDGRLAVGLYQPDQPQAPPQALVTGGGTSWQLADCPPGWRAGDHSCSPQPSFGDGLWLSSGGTQVSMDEGASWQPIVVTPDTTDTTAGTGGADLSPSKVLSTVTSPSGGWLGVGYRDERDLNRYWSIVRSADGVLWETVLQDPCRGIGSTAVEAFYGHPVPFGDDWLVVHTCFRSWWPQRSELYLLDQDGSNPRRVASTDTPGLYFAQPDDVDGAVVVPELDLAGTGTFLHLRP
jgi:hypothetical protein